LLLLQIHEKYPEETDRRIRFAKVGLPLCFGCIAQLLVPANATATSEAQTAGASSSTSLLLDGGNCASTACVCQTPSSAMQSAARLAGPIA
jgi:hypothetical protein